MVRVQYCTLPELASTLCDLSMAYRTIPTSQPWFTSMGLFDPLADPPGPRYYYLPGHNFGLVSAVVNFNRFPELVVVSARALAAVPVDHYYDDLIVADTNNRRASNQNVGYTPDHGLGGSDRSNRKRDTLYVFRKRVGKSSRARVMMSTTRERMHFSSRARVIMITKRERTHLRCQFNFETPSC